MGKIQIGSLPNTKHGRKKLLTLGFRYGILTHDELPKTAGTIRGVSKAPAEEEL